MAGLKPMFLFSYFDRDHMDRDFRGTRKGPDFCNTEYFLIAFKQKGECLKIPSLFSTLLKQKGECL